MRKYRQRSGAQGLRGDREAPARKVKKHAQELQDSVSTFFSRGPPLAPATWASELDAPQRATVSWIR